MDDKLDSGSDGIIPVDEPETIIMELVFISWQCITILEKY
jgi:hypothetical protein